MKLWLKNYLSTLSFIGGIFVFYNSFEYFRKFFTANYYIQPIDLHITSVEVFTGIILLYIFLLPIFYFYSQEKWKSLIIFEYFWKVWKYQILKPTKEEKIAFLAWWVKAFWGPLMISFLAGHIATLINKLVATIGTFWLRKINFLWFFDTYFFPTCFSLILFFDTFFFTLGYLIESPKIKNTIKSVEPTILWWAVAIACYPPFNGYITNVIGWYSEDFPKFENIHLHINLNILILVLMGIYSWASISLWLKASNLTNRGIVTKWPYRFVRHPAYISKNLAWWIGGLPILITSLQGENYALFFSVILSLSCWTFLYFMRAVTEEKHLSKDSDYKKYKEQVRYRFIPWVF